MMMMMMMFFCFDDSLSDSPRLLFVLSVRVRRFYSKFEKNFIHTHKPTEARERERKKNHVFQYHL
jgi:hypothetical protein